MVEEPLMGRTSIQVSDELADVLHERKERGDSYEDVIWRLVRRGGSLDDRNIEDLMQVLLWELGEMSRDQVLDDDIQELIDKLVAMKGEWPRSFPMEAPEYVDVPDVEDNG